MNSAILSRPACNALRGLAIIGYPKNLAEAKDKWKEENISYNTWMEKNS